MRWFRPLVVLLATTLASALVAGTAYAQGPPSPGHVTFNHPLGAPRAQYALVRTIDTAIDRTPPGATIRLAAYSFAMPSTSQALIRAYHRGVRVKVVVDDHSARWGSVRRLGHVLGRRTGQRGGASFLRLCHDSCRGTKGRQHAKFVTISRTTHARQVVMVGSMNFTDFAAAHQFQDLYTVTGERALFRQLRRVFRQMAADRPQRPLDLPAAGQGLRVDTSPVAAGLAADPVLGRLTRVHCGGVADGTGIHGRTLIRISMHAWNGPRGVALARQVAALSRQGCNAKVVAGVGFGRRVVSLLDASGVGLRRAVPGEPATHEKLMVLSGHLGRDRAASVVWTGSHNWTDRSLRNDEVMLRVAGERQVAAYRSEFRRIWGLSTR